MTVLQTLSNRLLLKGPEGSQELCTGTTRSCSRLCCNDQQGISEVTVALSDRLRIPAMSLCNNSEKMRLWRAATVVFSISSAPL